MIKFIQNEYEISDHYVTKIDDGPCLALLVQLMWYLPINDYTINIRITDTLFRDLQTRRKEYGTPPN